MLRQELRQARSLGSGSAVTPVHLGGMRGLRNRLFLTFLLSHVALFRLQTPASCSVGSNNLMPGLPQTSNFKKHFITLY